MAFACISLGSNLQEPATQVAKAIDLLSSIPETSVIKHSKFYETQPWGLKDQPAFVNAVAALETQLRPMDLLNQLQNIERHQGRIRDKHWGPRILDLDIICYDQLELDEARLTLPHPYFSERMFVLEPLNELYPDLIIANKAVKQWLQALLKTGESDGPPYKN